MRKSERIRQLELQMVRLQMEVEIVNSTLAAIINGSYVPPSSDLDSGKWYNRKND